MRCPDREILQRFVLGQLPPAEVESLAEHVEDCALCVERLHAVQGNDALLGTMRALPAEQPEQATDLIVPIYQVNEDRGIPYLTMPLLQGETLEDRLRREAPLPSAEVLRIGREIALGLAAAHAVGLIHRDVKPSNIMLVSGGVVSGE